MSTIRNPRRGSDIQSKLDIYGVGNLRVNHTFVLHDRDCINAAVW